MKVASGDIYSERISREKYSIQGHFWLSWEIKEHFPSGVDPDGPFSLDSGRNQPYVKFTERLEQLAC